MIPNRLPSLNFDLGETADMLRESVAEVVLIHRDQALAEFRAGSGLGEALDYLDELAEKTPRKLLIFFDINMPAMDGFEFLSTFEQRSYTGLETTIVMLTSSINSRDIDRAKQYRLYDIMEKPLTLEKLNGIFSDLNIK